MSASQKLSGNGSPDEWRKSRRTKQRNGLRNISLPSSKTYSKKCEAKTEVCVHGYKSSLGVTVKRVNGTGSKKGTWLVWRGCRPGDVVKEAVTKKRRRGWWTIWPPKLHSCAVVSQKKEKPTQKQVQGVLQDKNSGFAQNSNYYSRPLSAFQLLGTGEIWNSR